MQSSYLNKYFKLSLESTKEVLKKYIKPKYNIAYDVKQSNTTNSVYVTFYGDQSQMMVRLSDHPNKKFIFNYISKRTRVKKVVAIFKNSLKALQLSSDYRRLSHLYKTISDVKDNTKSM